MSNEALTWAFRLQLHQRLDEGQQSPVRVSAAKAVLVALADNANEQGQAWVSLKGLVYKTELDRKTIIASLDALEGVFGAIEDTGARVGRTNQVKVYRLTGLQLGLDLRANPGRDPLTEQFQIDGVRVPNRTPKSPVAGTRNPQGNPQAEPSLMPARRLEAKEAATRAIGYLNEKAGTHYRPTPANLKFGTERILRDEATEADLKAVVDLKLADRDFDRKYLRPETLWNATKFASYIGQVGAKPPSAADPDTVVAVLGEAEDGTETVLFTSSGRGDPDPERLARHALTGGYVRTKYHNRPCRNIVVQWGGRRSVFAMADLQPPGRRP